MYKILTEASGGLTSSYLIRAIKEAGFKAISSDINQDIAGRYLADEFILMPKSNDKNLWCFIENEIKLRDIQCVIPSLDETLLGWAKEKNYYHNIGVNVVISSEDVINTFQDKWFTYKFFKTNDIPTPETSLTQEFQLIKPRVGRGSTGIFKATGTVNMEGRLSQEYIEGIEYTIDVLCDKDSKPIFIIPRRRMNVKDGKSTAGVVVNHPKIIDYVKKICDLTSFIGPINIQCIETESGDIKFIEINPRIAGGMALGFAASENWIKVIIDHFVDNKEVKPVKVKYGLKMMRYYSEVFTY